MSLFQRFRNWLGGKNRKHKAKVAYPWRHSRLPRRLEVLEDRTLLAVEQLEDRIVPVSLVPLTATVHVECGINGSYTNRFGTLFTDAINNSANDFGNFSESMSDGFFNFGSAAWDVFKGSYVQNGIQNYAVYGGVSVSGGVPFTGYGDQTVIDGNLSGTVEFQLLISPDSGEEIGDRVNLVGSIYTVQSVSGQYQNQIAVNGTGSLGQFDVKSSVTSEPSPGSRFTTLNGESHIGDVVSGKITFEIQPAATVPIDNNPHFLASVDQRAGYAVELARSDIIIDRLNWDSMVVEGSSVGPVDIDYSISNNRLRQPSTIALYWSSNNDKSGIIGKPITQFSTATAIGSYTKQIPLSSLGYAPQGAKYLVAVADPNGLVSELNEGNNAKSLGISVDLEITDVQYVMPRTKFGEEVQRFFANPEGRDGNVKELWARVTVRNNGPVGVGPYNLDFYAAHGASEVYGDAIFLSSANDRAQMVLPKDLRYLGGKALTPGLLPGEITTVLVTDLRNPIHGWDDDPFEDLWHVTVGAHPSGDQIPGKQTPDKNITNNKYSTSLDKMYRTLSDASETLNQLANMWEKLGWETAAAHLRHMLENNPNDLYWNDDSPAARKTKKTETVQNLHAQASGMLRSQTRAFLREHLKDLSQTDALFGREDVFASPILIDSSTAAEFLNEAVEPTEFGGMNDLHLAFNGIDHHRIEVEDYQLEIYEENGELFADYSGEFHFRFDDNYRFDAGVFEEAQGRIGDSYYPFNATGRYLEVAGLASRFNTHLDFSMPFSGTIRIGPDNSLKNLDHFESGGPVRPFHSILLEQNPAEPSTWLRWTEPLGTTFTGATVQLAAFSDRALLTPGRHVLDVLLVGPQGEQIALGHVDLATQTYVTDQASPLGWSATAFSISVSPPPGQLQPGVDYRLEIRLTSDQGVSGEHVAVDLMRLASFVNSPFLVFSSTRGASDDGRIDFGIETAGSATSTLTLANDGTAPLDISSATIAGTGFEFVSPSSLPLQIPPGQSANLQVRVIDLAGTPMAVLHLLTNDPLRPSIDISLAVPQNSAPTLPPINDLFVPYGSVQTVLLGASDSDGANQVLEYTLEPGAPTSITVGPGGALLATSGDGVIPGTYEVTVRVSDQGLPRLSATRTFHVTFAPPILVTTTADSGPGSLREAILTANAQPGLNRIDFAIGTGPQSISLLSGLPWITDPVILDGTTQPGYAGTPLVEIEGSQAGVTHGLVVAGNDSTVRGLVINRFAGSGIVLLGEGNHRVEGNYLGTDRTGTVALDAWDGAIWPHAGVAIIQGHGNIVGTDADGIGDSLERNIISGNIGFGVLIWGAGTDENTVAGNFIGTDASGGVRLGNTNHGVAIAGGARFNIIGTNGDGRGDEVEGNVVSGNLSGIVLGDAGTSDNVVAGNYVGTDVTGTARLGNTDAGVVIVSGAAHNRVGTDGDGTGDAAERNVISANTDGVFLGYGTGTDGNVVAGNYIGTDATGTVALGNTNNGIYIYPGSDANRIGTDGDGRGDAAEGNIISGNTKGIWIFTDNNRVSGNRIGVNAAGAALGNVHYGVVVVGSGNGIGDAGAASGNAIAHNGLQGVLLLGDGTGNVVRGNAIWQNGDVGIAAFGPSVPAPPILIAAASGPETRVVGTFQGVPDTGYRLDFYVGAGPDPTGDDEGAQYLSSFELTTDASGASAFDAPLPAMTGAGAVITATATPLNSAKGSTSPFSGGIMATGLSGSDLIIGGGAGNDTVSLSQGSVIVVVNGVELGHFEVPVGSVRAFGLGGDDSITADAALRVAMVLDGGAGSDRLQGGSGVNALLGGTGNDVLIGGTGTNLLDGGAGDDQLQDGGGTNTMIGGDGNNSFQPGHGTSSFVASAEGGIMRFAVPISTRIEAGPDTFGAWEDLPLDVAASGVLANDHDPEGRPLFLVLVTGPTQGTLDLRADGAFRYTPRGDFSGSDSFTYQVSNGIESSDPVTVTILVAPIADLPELTVGSVSGVEGGGGTFPLDIQARVTDPDGSEALSIVIRGVPEEAALSAGTDEGQGTWHLTPGQLTGLLLTLPDDDAQFELEVIATATEANGNARSATAPLPVHIANVAPEITLDDRAPTELREGEFFLSFGSSFADPGADVWTATVDYGDGSEAQPLTLNPEKTFVLSHAFADDGHYTVTVTVTDGDGGVSTGTLSVTVDNVAPIPVIARIGTTQVEGAPISVIGIAVDPAGSSDTVGLSWAVYQGKANSAFASGSGSSFSFTPEDNGDYRIVLTTSDEDGGTASTEQIFAVDNFAPTATLTNGGAINEGTTGSVSFSGQADPSSMDALAGLHYAYDYNNDGIWDSGDGTYAGSGTSASTIIAAGYLDDGPQIRTVRARILDKDGGYTDYTTDISINNAPPTAGISGPTDGSLNTAVSFTFTASDLSSSDRAAGFTYMINWGDGSAVQTIKPTANNGGGAKVSHTYTKIGEFTVSVTATDKDSGVGTAATVSITIKGAQLITDPGNNALTALVVGGTSSNDTIRFTKNGAKIEAFINGASQGLFSPTGHLIAYGEKGNDSITEDTTLAQPTIFYGQSGNDTLTGGNSANILIGGDGNDSLTGYNGRDILIGGRGADTLNGGSGDDILVAGYSSYDERTAINQLALCAIMAEWGRADLAYASRIAHLQNGGGLNGSNVLNNGTVFDDSSVDLLTGGNGDDWFYLNLTGGTAIDKSDKKAGEITTDAV